jgi:hypothetical protein
MNQQTSNNLIPRFDFNTFYGNNSFANTILINSININILKIKNGFIVKTSSLESEGIYFETHLSVANFIESFMSETFNLKNKNESI